MYELKDAMKALGIHMTKLQINELMERIDKDGSGQLEKKEFIALMSEIMNKRNANEEMKKVFRFYDNDDDGGISIENIWQAADQLDMEDECNESNVTAMIEMADRKKKGEVDEEDFLELMRDCGLIKDVIEVEPESDKGHNSSFERALE